MTRFTTVLFLLAVAVGLSSCGSEPGSYESAAPGKAHTITITNKSWYALDAANSTVEWNRMLDQKASTKKMKIFGNWSTIELGPMQLETSGTVDLAEGIITTENDALHNGVLVFDMQAFNLNDEEGGGLFKVRDFPRSKFIISSFEADSGSAYQLTGNLTLQDSTQNMAFPVVVDRSNNQLTVNGAFVLHTLDWPLRDPEARKIVNTDDITITMNLAFKPDSSASDTVIVLE